MIQECVWYLVLSSSMKRIPLSAKHKLFFSTALVLVNYSISLRACSMVTQVLCIILYSIGTCEFLNFILFSVALQNNTWKAFKIGDVIYEFASIVISSFLKLQFTESWQWSKEHAFTSTLFTTVQPGSGKAEYCCDVLQRLSESICL